MEYYELLTVATAIIAVLAAVLYQTRRDVGILVGIAALYYWSLYGAWWVVIDKSGGWSGKFYHYLEFKMFAIALDDNYLLTIALYAAFIITVELTLLVAVTTRPMRPFPRLKLRHEPILLLGFAAGLASVLIMRKELGTAWATNVSVYLYTRRDPGPWFTLHQVLNRVALIPPAIGVASLAAGERGRFFTSVRRVHTWPAYAVLLGGMCTFTFILGNKNENFTALIVGFLAYVALTERPSWTRAGIVIGIGVWFLSIIDMFRGTPLSGLGAAVAERLSRAGDLGTYVSSNNEAFAAHFSLYGVLAARTPVNFAYSFYSLACSLVPRVLWPDRPRDIYLYYSESVGTIQDQGYALHHATGWYLNFGYAGVLLGGLVMGLVWAGCLNARRRWGGRRSLLLRVFAIVAPWTFVASIPPMVRAGPEAYKGFLIEGLLIPVVPLAIACREKRRTRETALRRMALASRGSPSLQPPYRRPLVPRAGALARRAGVRVTPGGSAELRGPRPPLAGRPHEPQEASG